LIEVSKEKGKREARKDLKKIKAEFKKVVELNSYLHTKIESINEAKLLKDFSPSNFKDLADPSIASSPFISESESNSKRSINNKDGHMFNTAKPPKVNEKSKENINMFKTENKDDSGKIMPLREGFNGNYFPELPLIKDVDSSNSDNFMFSSMMQSNDSNSPNEIENII